MTTNWSVRFLQSWVLADPFMTVDETSLWERLAQSRRAPLEPTWLGEVYSPSLSLDLRRALCEKLGMQAESGWPVIQQLLNTHGLHDELILSAGLCHQVEARDWLLHQLTVSNDDQHTLAIVQALSCWGADVPETVVTNCLKHPGQQQRLAGLQLLTFRSHALEDDQLLKLCETVLDDFRAPVVIAAIRLLQRRDGDVIAKRLALLCTSTSDAIASAAFRALGCIATPTSQRHLLELSQTLENTDRRQQASAQLAQQFRH